MHGKDPYETLGEGRFIRLVRSSDGWEHVERTNAHAIVAMVPVTDDGKLVLIEQYRAPVRSTVIEIPAGLVGDIEGEEDINLVDAARRELIEETGFDAAEFIYLTAGPPSPGLSTEHVTFYLARGLTRVGPGGGDDDETIVVHEIPAADVHGWLDEMRSSGHFVDPKVYTGLYFYERTTHSEK